MKESPACEQHVAAITLTVLTAPFILKAHGDSVVGEGWE
jgi:hypothetical protein